MKKTRLLAWILSLVLLVTFCCACKHESADPVESNSKSSLVTSDDDGLFDVRDDLFGDTSSEQVDSEQNNSNATKSNKVTSNSKTSSTSVKVDDGGLFDRAKAALPKFNLSSKEITILSHANFETADILENVYGLKVKNITVSTDAVTSRFVQMVNAGTSPDLFWNNYTPQFIAKKYVQAWDDHIDFSENIWKDIKASFDSWKLGGKHYYIYTSTTKESIVLYNNSMFQAKNLKTPGELFKQNKWTWDTMADYAKKLTVDANNDGTPEQYGLAMDGGVMQLIGTTGTDIVKFVNGAPKNMLKSANITRAVNYYVDLNKNVNVLMQGDMLDAFGRGEVAMLQSSLWVAYHYADKIRSGEYMFTTVPRDPDADAHYCYEETPGFYLPKGAKNIDGAVAFMYARRYGSYSDEYKEYSTKNELANNIGFPKEGRDMLTLINKNTTGVQLAWTILGVASVRNDIISRPLNGESWSTICESLSPKIDSQIKTFLSQATAS